MFSQKKERVGQVALVHFYMDDMMVEGKEEFTWSLLTFYNFEMLLSIGSLAANTLLLCTLKRFSVFHDHLRVICIHMTFTIILSSVYSLLRAIVGTYQLFVPGSQIPDTDDSCDLSEAMPFSLCLQLCILSIILSVERFYATMNYHRYEDENVEKPLRYLLLVTWMPIVLPLAHILSSVYFHEDMQACGRRLNTRSLLSRNIGIVIAIIFSFIFTAVFLSLKMLNGQRQIEYIRHHYRSLSTRFQIGENLRTCGVMSSMHLLSLMFFGTAFALDLFISGDPKATDSMREFPHILLPVFACLFPTIFVGNDRPLRGKFTAVFSSLFIAAPIEKSLMATA
ncbi:unnamed protein product, partial [Mesorhabditis spiculigera]